MHIFGINRTSEFAIKVKCIALWATVCSSLDTALYSNFSRPSGDSLLHIEKQFLFCALYVYRIILFKNVI